MESKYWFRSAQFKIQDAEDEFTNPGRFGKSLAQWLSAEFSALGYETEVIPEDWGWCVMCVRGEFLLWIGCGCVQSDGLLDSTHVIPLDESAIVWHIFTEVEVPFFKIKSLLRKWVGNLDLASPLNRLNHQLHMIIKSNESISLCEEP
jgi:hypothetical protein